MCTCGVPSVGIVNTVVDITIIEGDLFRKLSVLPA